MTGGDYDPSQPRIYTAGHPSTSASSNPSDDLALLVRILEHLPPDLQERIPAADVVRIIHATLREVRR